MKTLNPTPENIKKCDNLDFVKEYITPKFLDPATREKYKKLPHKTFLSLAVFYAINLDNGQFSCIDNEFLNKWNITIDKLDKIAFNNIEEYKFELTADKFFADWDLYALTNPEHVDGCVQIIRTEILKEISAKIGEYYILPATSSFAIIIPKKDTVTDEEFINNIRVPLLNKVKMILPNATFITDTCFGYNEKDNNLFEY